MNATKYSLVLIYLLTSLQVAAGPVLPAQRGLIPAVNPAPIGATTSVFAGMNPSAQVPMNQALQPMQPGLMPQPLAMQPGLQLQPGQVAPTQWPWAAPGQQLPLGMNPMMPPVNPNYPLPYTPSQQFMMNPNANSLWPQQQPNLMPGAGLSNSSLETLLKKALADKKKEKETEDEDSLDKFFEEDEKKDRRSRRGRDRAEIDEPASVPETEVTEAPPAPAPAAPTVDKAPEKPAQPATAASAPVAPSVPATPTTPVTPAAPVAAAPVKKTTQQVIPPKTPSTPTAPAPTAAAATVTTPAPTAAPALTAGSPPKDKGLSQSEAEALVQKIDRVNKHIDTATQPNAGTAPEPTCKDCTSTTPANPRYEQCSAKNNYLEQVLSNANNIALQTLKDHEPKKETTQCIAESMQMVDTSKFQFYGCPTSQSPYAPNGNSSVRPCASERMVKAVASSFELVTSCLAGYVDAEADGAKGQSMRLRIHRLAFQLFNHESNWIVNSVEANSFGGIGHLVSPMIASVTHPQADGSSEWSKMKAYMAQSKNSACQKLAKANIQPLSSEASSPTKSVGCDRTSLENGNPIANMMHAMGYLKLVRAKILSDLQGVEIAPQIRPQLIDQVTIWGYKLGGGVSDALKKTLQQKGASLKGQKAGFPELKGFLDGMQAAAPPARAKYLEESQNTLTNLEKRLNGSICGVL